MRSLSFGLILLAASALAVLPAGLGWWEHTANALRGILPIAALAIGVWALIIGVKDLAKRRASWRARGRGTVPPAPPSEKEN